MTTASPASKRGLLFPVIKWVIAIGLLSALLWFSRGQLATLRERQILWSMFAAALGVRFLALLTTFGRWRMLIRGIGLKFSYREAFRLGILGEACNVMAPGAVGGDLVKAAMLASDNRSRTASVMATVFLDRVLGMWALFVLGALASLSPVATKLSPQLQWTVWALWGGTAAGLIGITLMFIPAFTHSKLMHWLTGFKYGGKIVQELMDSIQLYQGRPQILIGAALLAIGGHLGFLTSFYFCAQSIHQGQSIPGFVDHVVGLPLPEALSAAVPSPGGLGALEGAVAWFYQQHQLAVNPQSTPEQLSTALSNGVLTALMFRMSTLFWGAIGILYYLLVRKEIRRAVQAVDSSAENLNTDALSLSTHSPAA